MRNIQIFGILADQYGNGVGILGARDAEPDERRLSGFERDLRGDDGRSGAVGADLALGLASPRSEFR